jgi:hypothetical protein
VFDPSTSTIYIIGGLNLEKGIETSDIYSFSLVTNQWGYLVPESQFIPDGMESQVSVLGPNRVIYTFFGSTGPRCISNVLTFDIKTLRWGVTEFQGDYLSGRTYVTVTSFTWKNEPYVAVYGGFDRDSYDKNLYL